MTHLDFMKTVSWASLPLESTIHSGYLIIAHSIHINSLKIYSILILDLPVEVIMAMVSELSNIRVRSNMCRRCGERSALKLICDSIKLR